MFSLPYYRTIGESISPASPVVSKYFGEKDAEEEETEEEEAIGEERRLKWKRVEEKEIEEEIVEDMRKENENTRSLISDVTKWEKMRQAEQKLSESALTGGTIKTQRGSRKGGQENLPPYAERSRKQMGYSLGDFTRGSAA